MNLRPYQPTDLPGIASVYTNAIHTLAAPFYSPAQLSAWAPADLDLQRWEQRLSGLQTMVAEDADVLAGFVSYNHKGYLDLLFTNPVYARRGVATRLYLHAETTLRAIGVIRVFTHASLASHPFFLQQGFVVDHEETVECRGARLRRYAMHKHLQTADSD